jgi:fructosamine-3-kinase
LGYGKHLDREYLLLEYIQPSPKTRGYWEKFGESLAALHLNTSTHFGLDHNNRIGRLPQINTPNKSWKSFFVECRLLPQIELAAGLIPSGLRRDLEKLIDNLENILVDEDPALIHGDLWSGNVLAGAEEEVVLIDPAVYYANREIELAFTKLFGGFADSFYRSYNAIFPIKSEFEERAEVYNLYPLLVHLNMFGLSYLGAIKEILRKFI